MLTRGAVNNCSSKSIPCPRCGAPAGSLCASHAGDTAGKGDLIHHERLREMVETIKRVGLFCNDRKKETAK